MISVDDEFKKIKRLYEAAKLVREGGNPVVLLPQVTFQSAGREIRMDLLLYPAAHGGYPTRLFFERQIEGRGNNWTEHCVVGKSWWACSWGGVEANMSWPSILYAHLRAVA